jgi:cell division protein FtsI/penicillin-binding protein 2
MFSLPLLIVFQMVRIKVNPTQVEKLIAEGDLLAGDYKTFDPARGKIYDRHGNLLAGNQTAYEIGLDLPSIKNPITIAQTLNLVLGLDYDQVFDAANLEPSRSAIYAVVADHVPKHKVDQLEMLKRQITETYGSRKGKDTPSLAGLSFKPHLKRTYPEGDLAANVLGFVNRDGVGYFGVEEKFDDIMAGDKTTVWVPRDPNRVKELPETAVGGSLVLTIDRSIQKMVERVLNEALETSGSVSGTIVVMDPKSGEILAMVTVPRLDGNEYWNYSKIFTDETPYNRVVSQAYEPGSVFKVLTMAAALDSGAVNPDTTFVDTGVFEIGGTRIYNWDSGAWGPQDMTGCMQHSLNVCLAWIATQVGARDYYDYLQKFGIGQLTGIDLAGEAAGRLKVPGDGDWYDADLGTNAFGQGVAVTPIQMVTAVSAVANEGKMMSPHVVRSVVTDSHQHNIEQRILGMPISPESADTLTKMLTRSLETESSIALVSGYRVAGKTGTAEIPTPYGYTTNETNASFVGWGPIDDPRFVVYVWLERPKSSPWGSEVAAPVFSDVVSELVLLMDLPPDKLRQSLHSQ